MITANNVNLYNAALKALIANQGTTTTAIEQICNGDKILADSIIREFENRGFVKRLSSIYISIIKNSDVEEFYRNGGFTVEPIYNTHTTNVTGSHNIVGSGNQIVYKEESKRPLLEKLNWFVAILLGIAGLWEFLLKNIFS